MNVREVDRDDGDVAALFLALWSELDQIYGPNPGTEFRPEAMPADAKLFVAYDPTAIGCAALVPDGEVCEVKRMYVCPQVRGRGASVLLLGALEDAARGLGARALRLETGVEQPRAIAFYRREGFVPCPCWGAFADDPLSRCFVKVLT
ncbi:MAG: GNAT family N-acetyltransferase [Deltaproteobacteria bacterium]|jgi:putative acetyltransferase